MSKATLTFDLNDSDDKEDFKTAVKASDMKVALWVISQEIFRPARKHGYNDIALQTLMDDCGDYQDPEYGGCSRGAELVSRLEDKFYKIIEEYNIELD